MAGRPSPGVGTDGFVTVHEGTGSPQMSILMPLYGQLPFIPEAVAAVLAQEGVVCEVIISDDASPDRCLDTALATVEEVTASRDVAHRIVVRRGRRRLRRDHLHLLARHASCDVLMQAHGDDVPSPYRARRLLTALDGSGAALAASEWDTIDAKGRRSSSDIRLGVDEWSPPLEVAVNGHDLLIGCSMAWRRSALSAFPEPTNRTVPSGHDRLMVLRAWLAGGVIVVGEPLLERRIHRDSWGARHVDTASPEADRFGRALTYLVLTSRMRDDVEVARAAGMISEATADQARTAVDRRRADEWEALLVAHGELSEQGRVPLWVDDDMLRLANEGALADRLGRRARSMRPLRLAIDSARRVRLRLLD